MAGERENWDADGGKSVDQQAMRAEEVAQG